MRPEYIGVKYYSSNDMSIGYNFEKAKKLLDTLDEKTHNLNENTIPPKEIHEGDEFKAVLSSHHIAPFVFAMTTEERVTDLLQKYLDESPWLLTTLKEKCI